jgi:sugar lactone lactonase YvrE
MMRIARLTMTVAVVLAGPLSAQPAAAPQPAAQPAGGNQPVYTLDKLPAPGPLTPDPNAYPNPYRMETDFLKLPAGRKMGSTSAVAVDSKGHIWVAERCGANSCAGSMVNPIMEFDGAGNFIKDFGGGMTLFPHGFFIDAKDNVWLTDGRIANGAGGQVFKFAPDGTLLLTLGTKGVAGGAPGNFTEANAVIVARDGTIFVADGHTPDKGLARIVKFAPDGRYLGQFGTAGQARGQIEVPHALAFDSKGRLFVADRWNNRVSIFTTDGKFVDAWTQFGRPSGVFIDAGDRLYVTDSESRSPVGYGYNPGWKRGIRIGSASTGKVAAFIPDGESEPDKGATSGAEGMWVGGDGTIYGGTVKERRVVRFVPQAKR